MVDYKKKTQCCRNFVKTFSHLGQVYGWLDNCGVCLPERQCVEITFIFNKSQNLSHDKFRKLHKIKYGLKKHVKPNANNHMCFKWLHSLPSFFIVSKALLSMIELKKSLRFKFQLVKEINHQQVKSLLWHLVKWHGYRHMKWEWYFNICNNVVVWINHCPNNQDEY